MAVQNLGVDHKDLALEGRRQRKRSNRRANLLAATASDQRRLAILAGRIITVIVLIAMWQLFSGRVLPAYSISSPGAVAKHLATTLGSHAGWVNIAATSKELVFGFAIGVAAGTVGGIFLGSVRVAGLVLEPFISAVNGIPKIALAPLFVLLLGIGTWTDAIIAAMMVSLILFYNLYIGTRDINPQLIVAVRLVGGSRWDVLRYVVVPSLVSPFFAGVKAAGPFAILGVIIGEFVASYNGVGHLLSSASSNLNAAGVYSAIMILMAMGILLNVLLGWLDRWVGRRLGMAS